MHDQDIHRTTNGIETQGLSKRFGDFWALRDLTLEVPAGTCLGLLGHNGAGKTTAVRILATLSHPTQGTARVDGLDVVTQATQVRSRIGLAAQGATVDGLLTARANLRLVGRLYHLSSSAANKRADELLERLGLADNADQLAKTFSGGMRRRLDLAATLVGSPSVLFLDEPTTGLDPASRSDLWLLLEDLVGQGVTLLLTTQYLEEADRLADNIVVLDHGRAVATGSPAELKARIGGERIDVALMSSDALAAGEDALAQFAVGPAQSDADEAVLTIPIAPGTSLIEMVRALDLAGVSPRDIHRREATLDDVFLTLTSQPPRPARPKSTNGKVAVNG